MELVRATCSACRERRPAAMIATLGDGTEVALCRGCSETRANRRAFAAAFRGACAPACLTALAATVPRALHAARDARIGA